MKPFRRISGRVQIRSTGAYPEDFLSALSQENIAFKSLRREDALTVTLLIYDADLAIARRCAQRTMCSLEVVKQIGVFPQLQMMGIRLGYLSVLFGAAVLVLWLQGHIWFLSVSGNVTIPSERICQALEEYGIHFGTSENSLNLNAVKNKVLADIPELSWLTINTSGGLAEVIVRERDEKPVISRDSAPANVIAGKSGLITATTVISGQAVVQAGDVVQPGDILISGVADLDQTLLISRAAGEIQARTWNRVQVVLPDNRMAKAYTGRETTRYSVTLGKKTINFYKTSGISYGEYDKITENTALALPGGYLFPVTITRTVFREYHVEPDAPDTERAQALMESAAIRQLRAQLTAGSIVNARFSMHDLDHGVSLRGIAECLEDIGITKEIED